MPHGFSLDKHGFLTYLPCHDLGKFPLWREECHLSLVTTQAARCIGNMNGVAWTSHFPPYWLWRRPADLPSFKQASIRLAQRMLLLKMIVDVEPGFSWLPCPFLMGLLDDIPSGLEENSICKIEGLEKCLKLQKSWPQTHKLQFPFQFKPGGHTFKRHTAELFSSGKESWKRDGRNTHRKQNQQVFG